MASEAGAKRRMNDADMSSFFENMGMMLKAGITAGEAVDLLREEAAGEDRGQEAVFSAMTAFRYVFI